MKDSIVMPCADWAETLIATNLDDLSHSEREAFDSHAQSCPACAAFLAEYCFVDDLLHKLPPVEALPGLPPRLLESWAEQDRIADNPIAVSAASGRGGAGRRLASNLRERYTRLRQATSTKWIVGGAVGVTVAVVATIGVTRMIGRRASRGEEALKAATQILPLAGQGGGSPLVGLVQSQHEG
jgi:anti-sigma factor RsiW